MTLLVVLVLVALAGGVALVAAWRGRAAVAVTLLAALVLAGLTAAVSFPFLFQIARAQGHAMAPTIRDQDRLIVHKLAYREQQPRRGDIVMMRYPLDPSKLFVKRVIAGPGDHLRIADGRVLLNAQPLDDSYVAAEFRDRGSWGPDVVPPGHYFVMGDRRNNSSDSRHWGFVPRKYIIGRVLVRWWPFADAGRF